MTHEQKATLRWLACLAGSVPLGLAYIWLHWNADIAADCITHRQYYRNLQSPERLAALHHEILYIRLGATANGLLACGLVWYVVRKNRAERRSAGVPYTVNRP